MTPGEYKELVDFLGRKFDRIDERFDQVDERFENVEGEIRGVRVLVEENRSDIRKVAEGVITNGERLDRFQAEVRQEFAEVRQEMKWGFDHVHARVDGVQASLSETRAELAETRERMDAGFEGVHARMGRFEGDLGQVKAARRV